MREAQFCAALDAKYRNLRELRSSTHLTSPGSTLYCGDCTEVGAPEVDGLLIGTRFGGGQSGSRTREPPPRCFFCWSRNSHRELLRHQPRLESAHDRRNLVSNANERKLRHFPSREHLTECIARPRFPCAPRTEHRRLMAPRSAPASAEVNREAGRRGNRLGAFFVVRTASAHVAISGRAADIGCPRCAASSPSSAQSSSSTPCCSAR